MPEHTLTEPGFPAPAGAPVFVDPSGRRLLRARLLGVVVLAALVGYVVLVGSAFVEAPPLSDPGLPSPAQLSPPEVQAGGPPTQP